MLLGAPVEVWGNRRYCGLGIRTMRLGRHCRRAPAPFVWIRRLLVLEWHDAPVIIGLFQLCFPRCPPIRSTWKQQSSSSGQWPQWVELSESSEFRRGGASAHLQTLNEYTCRSGEPRLKRQRRNSSRLQFRKQAVFGRSRHGFTTRIPNRALVRPRLREPRESTRRSISLAGFH